MATTVDTLEEVYKLTDHYTPTLNKISRAVRSFHGVAAGVTGVTQAFASAFGSLPVIGAAITAVVGLTTAGVVAFGKGAVDAGLEIERLTGTFTALSGSADRARQKLGWLQSFAQTSIGQFADLAQAGAQLEASGLNMERILPLISNISAAFGGTREQVLELASAFGRVPSGVFGESMEIFRRFGITAGDLMAQGLKMSGNGQFQATASQMLTAIENVAKQKFGKIGEALGNSLGVKISNLEDAWKQMTATLGQTFFPVLKQIVDSVTQFVNFIKDSGWIQSFGESLTATFGQMFGDGSAIFRFFSYVLAFLEHLPQIISVSWNFLKGMFTDLGSYLTGYLNAILKTITDSVNLIAKAVYDLGNLAHKIPILGRIVPAAGTFHELKPLQMSSLADFMTKMGMGLPFGVGDIIADTSKRGDELYRKFQAYQQRPGQGGATAFEGGFFNGQSVAQSMQETAQNTAIIAGNTNPLRELRKFVVGGGPLAAFGITPVELGRGRSREQQVQVSVGTRPLEQAVGDIVNGAIGEMIRQGVLKPAF